MQNIQQVLAFASAARHASFAKAARELALSPSAVAKSVSRFEAQLGVKLFYRTTRKVNLTPDGRQIFAQCQRILDEVETLKSTVSGARSVPSGKLCISAPLTFGKLVVLPALAQLLAKYPQLSVDARLTDQVDDLVLEGLDAAVRIGPLEDSRLIARTFAQQVLMVSASPAYLKARGKPKQPRDVERHECVLFRLPASGRDRPWEFLVDGAPVKLRPPARLRLSDGEALVSAALDGLGLVQAPHYMIADAMREGRLVECLKEFRPAPLPISVVHPGNRMLAPRVRAFIDALTTGSRRVSK